MVAPNNLAPHLKRGSTCGALTGAWRRYLAGCAAMVLVELYERLVG